MDNGIVQVTLSKPGGIVTGIQFNGIDNLLEVRNKETNRGCVVLHLFFSYMFDNFELMEGQSYLFLVLIRAVVLLF